MAGSSSLTGSYQWRRPPCVNVLTAASRSGSMGYSDQRPLQGTPTTARISASCNNRLGSVYSSLYAFWTTRAAIHGQPGQAAIRRDAYSVVLFDDTIVIPMQNDFQSSPDQLLDMVLRYPASGGTNFNLALSNAQAIMERHWSTDRCLFTFILSDHVLTLIIRTPVVVFLSDGECSVNDSAVQDVSQRAITLGYVSVRNPRPLTSVFIIKSVAISRSTRLRLGLLSPPSSVWCSSLPRSRAVHQWTR
jgi:hypothetical protein